MSWAAAPPTAPAARSDVVAHLLFVGDIMLGRYVGASIARFGPDAPFAAVRSWLAEPDITIGNLEGPLVPANAFRIPSPAPYLLDLTGDERAAGALARAGVDVLSVANNHSLDAGVAGLAATRLALERAGIAAIGTLDRRKTTAGAKDDRATYTQTALVREVRGVRIAFLAYTLVLNPIGTSSSRRSMSSGDDEGATVAFVDPDSTAGIDRAAGDVTRARGVADVVVVVMHWGTEYAARPSDQQRRVARALADAGADVVVGAHPHVVQGVDVMEALGGGRNTLVAYSLGNALFDQVDEAATRQGAAAAVAVDKRGVASASMQALVIAPGHRGFAIQLVGHTTGGWPMWRRTTP